MKKLLPTTIAFGLAIAPMANACDYCQQEVTLSQGLAQCYLALYEEEIGRMKESGLPAQLINLTVCEEITEKNRGAGSLPTVPLSGETPKDITTSFLLDEGGLLCLANDLRNENWPTDADTQKIKTFEVKRDCQ